MEVAASKTGNIQWTLIHVSDQNIRILLRILLYSSEALKCTGKFRHEGFDQAFGNARQQISILKAEKG